MIYQCIECNNAMTLRDWYDGFDHKLQEFSCPKCNKIHPVEVEDLKPYNKN